MTMMTAEREKGKFPISIGTSLAIEGALGIHPDRPLPRPPILKYQEVWFNVHTLFRNLMQSMKAEQQRAATVPDLYPALVEDLMGCETVIEQETSGKCRAIFYLCDYSGLAKKFPNAKLKVPSTPNQLIYQALEEATMTRLFRDHPPVAIRQFNYEITGHHPSTLIVTHFPVDLFARYRFNQLDLLESHTGKVKPPAQWNTKLSAKREETEMLPFSPFTLQVFGDNQHFSHQLLRIKEAVVETAKATGWSSITTMEKVKMTLDRQVKDPQILTTLHQFY
jgi:hypothetical protein